MEAQKSLELISQEKASKITNLLIKAKKLVSGTCSVNRIVTQQTDASYVRDATEWA